MVSAANRYSITTVVSPAPFGHIDDTITLVPVTSMNMFGNTVAP